MAFIDESFFKEETDYIRFTGPYMEAYLSSFLFEKGLAKEIGENIETFGIFNIITYNDIEGKSPNPIRLFNVPATIMTYPSIIETKMIDLHKTGEAEPFVVLKYYQNDLFCPTFVAKNSLYFKNFLEILVGGKIPTSTPYDAIFDMWKKNMDISGLDYDVSDSVYETVISEIYRCKSKPEMRFGMIMGSDPNHSPYDYRTANPRTIAKLNSTFTGVTFENMDEMLLSGVNNSTSNRKENVSPMEKVFKY